jgi:putative DNA primase/helicase
MSPEAEARANEVALMAKLDAQGIVIPQMTAEMRASGPQLPAKPKLVAQVAREPLPDGLNELLTDGGNATRLYKAGKGRIAFCFDWEKWLIWNGKYWAPDEHDEVIVLALNLINKHYNIALDHKQRIDMGDDSKAKKAIKAIVSHLHNSMNLSKIKAMIELAKGKLYAAARELDADPMLLTCRNGTINLRTGLLKEHCHADRITKYIDIEYDSQATSDVWETFLDEITQNEPCLKSYLQRAAGYTATGDTREQEIFILHGPSKTGKSLFINTIAHILGDHAMSSSFNTFATRRDNSGPRSDIARLNGARMVVTSETGEGKKFDAQLIKNLTGGTDKVTVAHKYKQDKEFVPQFKLWFACNHKPRVDSTDGAIWKRMNLIPFHNAVADENLDKGKAAILRCPENAKAILTWLVAGCLGWQEHGLATPAIVVDSTDGYPGGPHDCMTSPRTFSCTITCICGNSTLDITTI